MIKRRGHMRRGKEGRVIEEERTRTVKRLAEF